jgi:hypothetical protein
MVRYYYTLVYAHFMVNYTTIRYYTQVYAYFTLDFTTIRYYTLIA